MKRIIVSLCVMAFAFIYVYLASSDFDGGLESDETSAITEGANVFGGLTEIDFALEVEPRGNTKNNRLGSIGISNDKFLAPPFDLEAGDYASYSEDALRDMANMGDVKAMQFLGVNLLTEGRGEENVMAGKEYLKKAIIFGADYYPYVILAEASSLNLRLSRKHGINVSKHQKSKELIETFVYYELARRMNNSALANYYEKFFVENYDIEPTESDAKVIRSRASAMHATIIKERMELGL